MFGLLFNLGLGILKRLIPQMQVFFIGLPLSIILGLLLLLVVIGTMMGTFVDYLNGVLSDLAPRSDGGPAWRRESEFDKTEEPTQKRLDEALKRGDVVKSQEVNTWFVIAGATLVLMAFSGPMSRDLTATMRGVIANSYNISVDGPALPRLFQKIGGEMVAAMGCSIPGSDSRSDRGQRDPHRLVWSYQTLAPKLSKISPLAGLKRIFSKQALANLTKGLVKLAVVGTVMTVLMWPSGGGWKPLRAVTPRRSYRSL